MMEEEFFSDEDSFQEWLFFTSDVVETFIEDFKELQLDYSPESLIRLEKWILAKYPTPEIFVENESAKVLDGMLRYVGQVYVKQLKAKWDVVLDDKQYVYYSMPIVKISEYSAVSPFSELVASMDRRRDDYMFRVFMNEKKLLEEKYL